MFDSLNGPRRARTAALVVAASFALFGCSLVGSSNDDTGAAVVQAGPSQASAGTATAETSQPLVAASSDPVTTGDQAAVTTPSSVVGATIDTSQLTPPGPVDLWVPVAVGGNLEIALDTHRYTFEAKAGDQVSVEIVSANGGCADSDRWPLLINVVDSNSEQVDLGTVGYVQIWGCYGYGPWTLPTDGTYAFAFSGDGNAKGSYTAVLNRLAQEETMVDLSSPVTVEGSIDVARDTDRYTFTGTKGQRISVETTAVNGGCADDDRWPVAVNVLDRDGEAFDPGTVGYVQIWGCYGFGPWTLPADGTYSIAFTGEEAEKGTYQAILATVS